MSRPELSPDQAILLGSVLATLTKLAPIGVLKSVEPVTDEQGWTDTILMTGVDGERLVLRLTTHDVAEVLEPPEPDRLRESIHILLAELAELVGPDETLAYVERIAERMQEELDS